MNRRVFAVGMAGFCAFLGLYATQPLLPLLQAAFHASQIAVSLTVSAATLGVALAAPWVGVVSDLLGRKRVIVPAIWLMGVTYVLSASPAGLAMLVFWRFMQGLLTPAVFAVTVAYISEEWPHSQTGFVTSVYVSGTVLGGFTGRFLSGLVAAHESWRWSFVGLGLLNFAMAMVISTCLPKARHFSRAGGLRSALQDMAGHLHNRFLLTIYIVGFTILFGLVATFTYITFHLAGPPFSLGASALGGLFTVYLVGVIVTPLAGRWSNHVAGWKLLAAAQALSIIGILVSLVRSLPIIILGVTLCSTGVFVCQLVTNRAIGMATGKARASAVGLYVTIYYLGGFAGSIAPGLVWHAGGWRACVALEMMVLIAALLLVVTVWRRQEAGCLPRATCEPDELAT